MEAIVSTPTVEATRTSQRYASRWRRMAQSPWTVTVFVLLVYGVCVVFSSLAGHDPRDFIDIGRKFVEQSSVSSVIRVDPSYKYLSNGIGYDGQFCYYIALDPINARYYIDLPAYRYQRILYPMLARLLAFGQPGIIPYTLLLVNWLALGGGTLAVAAWLKRKGYTPSYALIYGLCAGLFSAFMRDLTEPLGFALVALAIYLYSFGGRRRILWAGMVFGLSALARETGLVFAGVYGLGLLLEGGLPPTFERWRQRIASRWQPVLLFFVTSVAPLALYKVFLLLWLGTPGLNPTLVPQVIPLAGLFAYWPWQGDQIMQVIIAVIPALICLGVALRALTLRIWPVEVWALLLNIELFIFMLPKPDYVDINASPRLSIGVVLAALYCLPAMDRALGRYWRRLWMELVGSLWLGLVPLLLFGTLFR